MQLRFYLLFIYFFLEAEKKETIPFWCGNLCLFFRQSRKTFLCYYKRKSIKDVALRFCRKTTSSATRSIHYKLLLRIEIHISVWRDVKLNSRSPDEFLYNFSIVSFWTCDFVFFRSPSSRQVPSFLTSNALNISRGQFLQTIIK